MHICGHIRKAVVSPHETSYFPFLPCPPSTLPVCLTSVHLCSPLFNLKKIPPGGWQHFLIRVLSIHLAFHTVRQAKPFKNPRHFKLLDWTRVKTPAISNISIEALKNPRHFNKTASEISPRTARLQPGMNHQLYETALPTPCIN